jgi:hypothetical protein
MPGASPSPRISSRSEVNRDLSTTDLTIPSARRTLSGGAFDVDDADLIRTDLRIRPGIALRPPSATA